MGGISAYYIWRQLTEVALSGQANVSERLASQSFEILKCIADDPRLYEYFNENKPLSEDSPERAKVLCCAEIVTNFLEHIVLQRPSLPRASKEAWMLYVRDHYFASIVVREFVGRHREWYADIFLEFIDPDQTGASSRDEPSTRRMPCSSAHAISGHDRSGFGP
ncbi:hypothetical protein [Methylovirgula sp. 4M-Z18]